MSKPTTTDISGDVEKVCPKMDDDVSWVAMSVCILVATTGLFHGYDNGVVNLIFSMPSFRSMMGWPGADDYVVALDKAWTVNGFNAGAAIAAVLSGHLLVDRYGRKPALILGSALFAVGGATQASATTPLQLIIGRLIAGVGVGITSASGPAYIAEVAPAKIRGAMVGVYQNNVCLAIVLAAVVNYADAHYEWGWRISLGLQIVMGVITAVGLLFIPETPRFLESVGRSAEALHALAALRSGNEDKARVELEAVRAELAEETAVGTASWTEIITNPFFRNVVIIGCFVQFFQILTGVNAIVSFSGTLFDSLGVNGVGAALAPPIAFLLANMIGSFYLADRIGRRPLLIWGMVLMMLTMLIGGITDLLCPKTVGDDGKESIPFVAGIVIIGAVVGFLFAFGISWGFGAWLYIPEIMPLRVRGKAVGLATGVNWGPANVASAFITPVMIASPMGPGGTLLFFAGVSALAIPFALLCLPETRGKTLEEITPLFHFSTCGGLLRFARGNLRDGNGIGHNGPRDDCSKP